MPSTPRTDLLRIGNESARDLLSSGPTDYRPADYVHVARWTSRTRGVECVTVTASYTPVGHGIASVVSRQRMDAVARRALPGARFDGPDRTTDTYGAFQLGARIRQYSAPDAPMAGPMPAWIGEPLPAGSIDD